MLFGTAQSGEAVEKITLSAGDLTVSVITWGAILQDVRLASVNRSLTLGAVNLSDYEGDLRHHGSLIGPIANRISNARIKIDGMMYELERNQDGRIHLHSGVDATHRRNWTLVDQSDTHVTLTCDLRDGVCGLPGNRTITVTYRVAVPATLTMELTGTSDAKTAMSFANHSYWNLDGKDTWDGHHLQVLADRYLPGTEDDYPTGDIVDVSGTSMDLREGRTINVATDTFDNNFCLSERPMPLRDVLTLRGASGVAMTIATTAPGMQVYDNKEGVRPGRRTHEGLALEAQNWPDAPNNPTFPSILIDADEVYQQMTAWRFSV